MDIGLKWVHMARYELILKQDGAILLRIILKPSWPPKGLCKTKKIQKSLKIHAKPAKMLQEHK